MPIRFGKNSVVLDGACAVEEALPLLEYLQAHPRAKVTMRGCTQMHTAVFMVLVGIRPPIASLPDEAFMKRWFAPALKGEQA